MTTGNTLRGGRYVLAERLGEGGMATVWKAFDQRLQVWRAIKILSPALATKKKIRSRFETEAQTMANLEHDHIVRVYDVDEDGDQAFIVMELVEGGNLVDWLDRNGPMPARMAVDVAIEVCLALTYAHDKGVIHRDIKPHNVMIDRKGVCRLTDFGIARAGDDDQGLTKTGAVMGTWGYMAPEQRSDAKHVDGRADVYAMGASLFSLVTNRVPNDLFAADQDPAILDGVPEALVPVVRRATEYKREARFGSAAELIAALVAVRDQLGALPAGTPPLAPDVPAPRTPPTPAPATDTIVVPGPQDPAPRGGAPTPPTAPEPPPRSGGPVTPTVAAAGTYDSAVSVLPAARRGWLVPATLLVAAALVGLWMVRPAPEAAAPVVTPLVLEPCASGQVRDPVTRACQAGPTPAACPAGQVRDAQGACQDPPPAEAACGAGTHFDGKQCVADPVQVDHSCKAGTRWDERAAGCVPTASPASPSPSVAPTPVIPPQSPQAAAAKQCLQQVSGPASVSLGASATFKAKVCTDGDVVLHYRASAGGAWYTAKMVSRLGWRTTNVNIPAALAGGIDWYVTAADVSDGSSTSPHHVGGG